MNWKCFFKHDFIGRKGQIRVDIIGWPLFFIETTIVVLSILFPPLFFFFLRFTNMAQDYYYDGFCTRCGAMWFDASNKEKILLKRKEIEAKNLEKFDKFLSMRKKAL